MNHKILTFILLFTIINLSQSAKHQVKQVNGIQLQQTISQSNYNYSLLYIYSSSCKYCSQFTPRYEKVSNLPYYNQKVQFLKIDGQLYKEYLSQYEVYSFPTILLFWKNYPSYPVVFRQERSEDNIKKFIQQNIQVKEHSQELKSKDVQKISVYERIQDQIVLYYGEKDSQVYQRLGLIWHRIGYFQWIKVTQTKNGPEKIVIGGKQLAGKQNLTISNIQRTIKKTFAKLHPLGEQSWSKIFVKKQLGVVYVNPQNNKKTRSLIESLPKQYEDIVFMQLLPSDSQYKAALKMLTVTDDQNIIAVDKKADAVFVANKTKTKQDIMDFIQKVQRYEWPVHRKTQKSVKEQKLTRANYDEKMATSQDVILFLYRREQKISKGLVQLFNHLRNKLKQNKNLLFLRCDVSSNQIDQLIGFSLQKTPKIVFFRNRMKDKPIHFYGDKISQKSMIQFIMENTTFDWQEQWEL